MQSLTVALLLVIAGCIPFPHTDQQAPEISGTLARHGQPLAGARVRLDVDGGHSGCGDDAALAMTDKNGRFHFERTASFAFFMWFGDRMDTWTVCFDVAPYTHGVWTDHGWWGGPRRQRLVCRFDAPPKPDGPTRLPSLAALVPWAAPVIDGCQIVTR